MEKNIEKYVSVKQNFLDNEFCQYTIKELEQLNLWKKHDWERYDPIKEQKLVTTSPSGENEPEVLIPEGMLESSPTDEKVLVLKESSLKDINDFIVQKIFDVMSEYVDNLKFEWYKESLHSLTNLKFIKYSLNQTMKVHCDHLHDLFDGVERGIPVFSIIGLLNDDYEGGNLVMFGDKKINTKEGDLIIFPSLFLFPHEIKPITKGIRYSYIAWMW